MSNKPQLSALQCSVTTDLDLETPNIDISMQCTHSNFSAVSSVDSSDSPSDERRETISVLGLLSQLSQVELDSAFAINGYKKLNTICDTLQGTLYKAQHISSGEYVAIKKVDKSLSNHQIAIDEDGTTCCVSEDIVKEAQILKYLTVNNTSIGRHIIRYIDFFCDEESHYLVMEYIESQMNLKQFASVAHQYIAAGALRRKHYQQIIKYLFWQLMVTIHWMHNDMRCCHLDLDCSNIMLKNCSFEKDKDGCLRINPSITVKLGDFGVSEMFSNDFECNKTDLSLDNASYLAPKVYGEQLYDARSADMWSLGMLMFECLTGELLYEPMDIFVTEYDEFATTYNGYSALHRGDLKRYLLQNIELKCFTADSLDLLLNLLQIDERRRFKACDILQHKWFKMYFAKYSKQIQRKSITQKERLLRQKKTICLDFYALR
eukprot:679487_1